MPSRIYLSPPHLGAEEFELVREAFATNWIAPVGPHVDAFEREFAAAVGAPHAVAVSSGTAALHLAMRLLKVGSGDEVFCSDLTFIASANPIVYQGATPVFIDSDRTTWNMDPARLEQALRDRAERGRLPRAVVLVHLYGQCAQIDALAGLCERYGVPLIEDAAEALGAVWFGETEKRLGGDGARSRGDGHAAGVARSEAEGDTSGCPSGRREAQSRKQKAEKGESEAGQAVKRSSGDAARAVGKVGDLAATSPRWPTAEASDEGGGAEHAEIDTVSPSHGFTVPPDKADGGVRAPTASPSHRLTSIQPGTRGLIGIYSFNGNKIITTSGGGMLVTADAALAQKARFLSTQARDPAPHYEHSAVGYNYRLSNVLAGIGRGQLRVLGQRVEARRRIFAAYVSGLSDLPGIEFMPETPGSRATRWLTCVLIDPARFGTDRETVRLALEAENIEARPVWKPMHLQPVFAGCDCFGGEVGADLFARGLCLPSGSSLRTEDIQRVTNVVRKCHKL